MAQTVHARLCRARERGQLTIADLAHWLERPYPTVQTWVYDGREPVLGPRTDELLRRIDLLERAIKAGKFPMDASMSAIARPKYVRATYAALSGSVPRNDLAARRA